LFFFFPPFPFFFLSSAREEGTEKAHSLFQKLSTGPPGTGKSLAAKRLARTAGLDYAILSGGDVAPLGPAAVPALHSLFDWAERSPRGLLLFVDEADAFLGRRGAASGQGEALRGALNATLFRTGDQSRDFCLVLATNRPSDLDPAVLDRVDEALLFPLPGQTERRRILQLYLDRYISHAADAEGEAGAGAAPRPLVLRARDFFRGRGRRDAIRVEGISDADVEAAARKTDGFSGRELAKLVASAQAAAYGTPDATLRRELFTAVIDAKVEEHKARARFVDEGAENEAAALALRGA
jgi:ATPase family AAA domain-containing protein 3A/B